jgi:hypothetical protein
MMGTSYTDLVDSHVSLADAPREGARMVKWLQARGIIGEGQREGDLYPIRPDDPPSVQAWKNSDRLVYPPGPNYREASTQVGREDHYPDWFRVYTDRRVYHAGVNELEIYCTQCGDEQVQHGDAWSDAIKTWLAEKPETLVCAKCGHAAPLSGWTFDWVWGFGNLGFKFDSLWELNSHFIEAFEKELGRPLTVVTGHM